MEQKKILEEIIAENFLNLVKSVNPETEESQQIPSTKKDKKHIIMKFLKACDKRIYQKPTEKKNQVQRNKDNNSNEFLFRNNKSKRKVRQHF